jgi:hypothetical protein
MQPYFFPYLGYFQLIVAVDRFVLFDDAQYMKGGWINRNRILKPHGGPQYINVPIVKHESRVTIKEIRAKSECDWKAFVLRQIDHYRKKAPFYPEVRSLLESCFELEEESVAQLDGHYLRAICDYLGISFEIEFSSAMNFDYSHVATADDWPLTIGKQLGASEYINPVGGAKLFDRNKFVQNDLKLSFLEPRLRPYTQGCDRFEPGLSIIDVLMFNDRKTVRAMIDDFVLL